jgi:bifunctional UDP-N-acetylglucosamine pyrophosphorylase / glucosamine-1-phosphate N-acetyltransferase
MNGKIIILAGGKGTRMDADIPKVLVEVSEEPMIEHLLRVIEDKPMVVVGFQSEKVKDQLGDRVEYVLQKEQLGTGHAVACAQNQLRSFEGPIVVLYGDHPLVSKGTIDKLFKLYHESKANVSMLTTELSDFDDWREGFHSFGRIIREGNNIVAIREMKDSSEEEKNIKEVNPGYYCFDSQWLWENIDKLRNENNQNEYYLTDLVELAVAQNDFIPSFKVEAKECLGVNTKEQLKLIEKFLEK